MLRTHVHLVNVILGSSPHTFTNLAEGDHLISILAISKDNPRQTGTFNIRIKVKKPSGEFFLVVSVFNSNFIIAYRKF